MTKARLRTKTGCLTCRKRKVKCEEGKPICQNCSLINRCCEWPSAKCLTDRRNRPALGATSPSPDIDEYLHFGSNCDSQTNIHHFDENSERHICVPPVISHTAIRQYIDQELFAHYHDSLRVMLLPSAHPGFHNDYRWRILHMALHCDSVKCAVLAWGASNKFLRSNDDRYRKAALGYYSQAISTVQQGLFNIGINGEGVDDSLMITLWGADSGTDAQKHVTGAMNLLNFRYSHKSSMLTPFDRVSVESVLYQAFLLAMRNPFSPNFHIDQKFLSQAETLLEMLSFESACAGANSPVLGLPLALYLLILRVIAFFGSSDSSNEHQIKVFEEEIRSWEMAVALRDTPEIACSLQGNPHFELIRIYVLILSLLLDLLVDRPELRQTRLRDASKPKHSLTAVSPFRWQVEHFLSLFRCPINYEKWTRCYIVLWPMLIIGYAVKTNEDILFVTRILKDMRLRMGYGEVQRVLDELQLVWAKK